MIPVDVPLRCWARAPVSWDSVGEAGGPLYVALRRSLSWAPWKVLRLVVPRGKRFFSGVLILCTDGELDGSRGEELQHTQVLIIDIFLRSCISLWQCRCSAAAHLAFSSVLSSMGGSVLFEGWPDADMDLVWRGRVELSAVEGVLPDTSVKLKVESRGCYHVRTKLSINKIKRVTKYVE